MKYYAKSLSRLIGELGKLPGIGSKTAQRLAFHVLSMSDEQARSLADSILEAKRDIRYCSVCGNFTGVHLAEPTLHDMHACVIMGGPGVSQYERKYAARIIDVAPTLAKLLGIDVPKDAEGGVIYDILDRIEK